MRSKATNILQVIVLITGIIYILIGIVFFISPLLFGRIFAINITEDWFNGIKYDTFVAPLYFMARGFAAMLFSIGLSMILPLFDPLRYRGLIYYTSIVFPILSSCLLLINGIRFSHGVVTLFGIIFLIILIFTIIGLVITNKSAKSVVE
ncbi:MAG: hypothetical protein SVZ03_16990 [Spirochaetota bacterium]|nr:hypothetical protein [Spirochaetota bacterium]